MEEKNRLVLDQVFLKLYMSGSLGAYFWGNPLIATNLARIGEKTKGKGKKKKSAPYSHHMGKTTLLMAQIKPAN